MTVLEQFNEKDQQWESWYDVELDFDDINKYFDFTEEQRREYLNALLLYFCLLSK